MTAPESDPAPENWKVFVPQRDGCAASRRSTCSGISRWSVEKSQALDHLRVYDFTDATWTEIAFPEPVYAASPGGTPDYESHDLPLQLPEPGHAVRAFTITTCAPANPRC